MSLYNENGILIKEYLIGSCESVRYYMAKIYTICNKSVIDLCNSVEIVSFKNPIDLEFMNGELFVSDASLDQVVVLDAQTFKEKRCYGGLQAADLASIYDELFFIDNESSSLRCILGNSIRTLVDESSLQHSKGLCIGQYGDGCGGGRVFITDTFNKEVKVYDRESNSMMTLCVLDEAPYFISKMGCNLYILCKEKIIKFNISTMSSEVFIEK